MNCIILGKGSIAKRHGANLVDLGHHVRYVDIDEISNLNNILATNKYDCGLVCSPTNVHISQCITLAEYNIPFFCEKPLTTSITPDTLKLLRIVWKKQLPNMVGCNLRFHPAIIELIQNSPKIKQIDVVFGYNLKKWHNDGKHLQMYSANRNMGGGVVFDCIHEFDYLYYVFGDIDYIKGISRKLSNVTVDTEDCFKGKIVFTNKVVANISLDYLQEEYQRYYRFNNTIKHINPNNEMYISEIKYFLCSLQKKEYCINNIFEAAYLIGKINENIRYSRCGRKPR